jgi:flavin reductase (DIM6/NTAB) family NADH-FMN oxidoreductase RutF
MGRFATGVTVVTTRLGDDSHGMTANAVTSVSLDPVLILVCVDKAADTHDILAKAGSFAVNILNREQEGISRELAGKKGEKATKLDGIPHVLGVTGSPLIEGSLAYLECLTVKQYEGGDHTIFLGEVVDAREAGEGEPLLFYGGRYGQFAGSGYTAVS